MSDLTTSQSMHPSWNNSLQDFEQIAAAPESEMAADQPLKFEGGKIVLFQGTPMQDVTLSTQEQADQKAMISAFRAAIREKMGVLPETFFETSHDPSLGFFSKESEEQALEHGLTPAHIKQFFEEIDKTPRATAGISLDDKESEKIFESEAPIIAKLVNESEGSSFEQDTEPKAPIEAIPIANLTPIYLVNYYMQKIIEAVLVKKDSVVTFYTAAKKSVERIVEYSIYFTSSDKTINAQVSLAIHEQTTAASFYERTAQESDTGNKSATDYWSTAAKSQERLAEYRINLVDAIVETALATEPKDVKEWEETADVWSNVIRSQEKAAAYSHTAAEMKTSGKWLSAFFSSIAASWWKSIADWQAW